MNSQKKCTQEVSYNYGDMYIFDMAEEILKAVIEQKRISHRDCPEELIDDDIILFRQNGNISHFAIVNGMAIIDVSWPVPADLIYGRVNTIKDITKIKPPLHLSDVLPDEAPVQYLYFDKFIKVDKQDQKLIEEYLKLS